MNGLYSSSPSRLQGARVGAVEKWISSQGGVGGAPTSPPSSSNKDTTSNGHCFLSGVKKEQLYEAYNELHGLAQELEKGLEAPAIVVVGHQTDGKSALIEALMGFQFNHVGGGTKTRRPITLHMKYNAAAQHPICYLLSEDNPPQHEDKTLEDIQAYIEAENMRLEQEACQFLAKEIIIKIEYKYCPNLTIIDTPGLIAAAPGRKNRILQAQARAVEALVRTKMKQKEFIILCLEDCSDWSNATTRRVVMQVDPEMSRTVIVSTKLDTKIPQFGRSLDVELFMKPPAPVLDGNILGETPFFTSVPSGRVGMSKDAVYRSNDEFKEAVASREAQDIAALEDKLGRPLFKEERARVGVSRLGCFLEELLQRRYMDSVPLIVPLLEKESRNITRKLQQIVQEIGDLDEIKLKKKGRLFRDSFLAKLSLLLKGTVVAPPDQFGETLQDERVHGGAFLGPDGVQIPHKLMPNAGMHLYGGAQYHRAMAEFRYVAGGTKCPPISCEEIVNACGVEDIHDGTNYFRTACVIAVAKARETFEPFLHQLGFRLSHILKRLLPITIYLLQKDGEYLSGHDMFVKRITTAFYSFADATERVCREKCMEDLMSTTRYVTWSLHNKNRAGLRQFLDFFSNSEQATLNSAAIAGTSSQDLIVGLTENGSKQENKSRPDIKPGQTLNTTEAAVNQSSEMRLVDLLESNLWNRKIAPSSEQIVNALVAQIFQGIRDHFVASAELKFNCFFLMPVVDKFPALLCEDLEAAFEDGLDNVFDVAYARQTLTNRKRDLEMELQRVKRLEEKFIAIHHDISANQSPSNSEKDVVNDITMLIISERV
uniref:ARC5 n=1 Tax=Hesperocyparis macrocarpa TaxID=76352 RepID=A0A3Q8BX25_9CONI|nr:ARC5 [Hesperocyparis macrocarpa]